MKTLLTIAALLVAVTGADAQKIRLRGMTEAAKDTLTYHTVLSREAVYCTDSQKLYVFGTDSAFHEIGPDTVYAFIDTISALGIYNPDGALAIPDSIDISGDVTFTTANIFDVASRDKPADTVYARSVLETGHNAGNNFIVVPDVLGFGFSTTTNNFTNALNDSIVGFAVYLEKPIALGEASVAAATLGGSCAVRTWSVGVYDEDFALIDTTAATSWPANSTGQGAAFVVGAIAGPGIVYFCWSVYNDNTCSQIFYGPVVNVNSMYLAVEASQNSTLPIIAIATNKLSAGGGWPSTITLTKATAPILYPYIVISGTNLD